MQDDIKNRALETINRMIELLDERYMSIRIDEPIDKAVEDFLPFVSRNYSYRQFFETAATFVQYMYKKALPGCRKLSHLQAGIEAVAILSEYEGTYANGFHGAVLDAADVSQSGLRQVITGMGQILKNRNRQMHLIWVKSRFIDPNDWQLKCAIAEILIKRCRKLLPPELQNSPPVQLADDIFELLTIELALREKVQPCHAVF